MDQKQNTDPEHSGKTKLFPRAARSAGAPYALSRVPRLLVYSTLQIRGSRRIPECCAKGYQVPICLKFPSLES